MTTMTAARQTSPALLASVEGMDLVWTGSAVAAAPAGSGALQAADAHADALARAWAAGALSQLMIAQERQRASEPHPGRTVRSTSTRGKNTGVVGQVIHVEVNHHNTRRTALRLQVRLASTGELRWLDADKVQVTAGFGEVRADAITQRAAHLAMSCSWATLSIHLGMRR